MAKGPIVLHNRLVQDPSMSDAEFLYQKTKHPNRPNVGKVYVQENAIDRIGALCFVRRRLQHHEMAAERFKTLYEARYSAGTRSVDPGRVQVDTSPIAHDSGMAAKLDKTRALRAVKDHLGDTMYHELVRVVVLGSPVGGGLTSRPAQRAADDLLAILDILAELWGFKARAA